MCVPVSTACLHVSYHHIYVYISMYAVAAPGGFLGFLETGQTLPAISFTAERSTTRDLILAVRIQVMILFAQLLNI